MNLQNMNSSYHCVFLVTYIPQITHHRESMLSNTRVYLRSIVRWSQSTTSGGMLLMFTRHFQHLWYWWQCWPVCDISHENGLERLDSHITFFFFLWDHWLTNQWFICINILILYLYVTWFTYTWFCNWHMFKWSYLIRTTLSSLWTLSQGSILNLTALVYQSQI